MSGDFDPWADPPSSSWNPPPPQDPQSWAAQTDPQATWGGQSAPQTNGLAIASLVCGILIFFCFFTWIPAIICGHMARGQIRESGGRQSGSEMATIGLALGYIGLGLTVLSVVFIVLGLFLAVSPMEMLR